MSSNEEESKEKKQIKVLLSYPFSKKIEIPRKERTREKKECLIKVTLLYYDQ